MHIEKLNGNNYTLKFNEGKLRALPTKIVFDKYGTTFCLFLTVLEHDVFYTKSIKMQLNRLLHMEQDDN